MEEKASEDSKFPSLDILETKSRMNRVVFVEFRFNEAFFYHVHITTAKPSLIQRGLDL